MHSEIRLRDSGPLRARRDKTAFPRVNPGLYFFGPSGHHKAFKFLATFSPSVRVPCAVPEHQWPKTGDLTAMIL
jgi:hypothetical protein